jgi:hypothetical protein
MHFRPLSEIDWREFLQASSVEIKIAPVVTRELEEQKALNPSRKLRERAATAFRLLHGYLGHGQVREGVTLEFLMNKITKRAVRTDVRGLIPAFTDIALFQHRALFGAENLFALANESAKRFRVANFVPEVGAAIVGSKLALFGGFDLLCEAVNF